MRGRPNGEASRRRWTSDDVGDQRGTVAVVTGANGGLGFEVVRVLAERGATVVLACRDDGRAAEAAGRLGRAVPDAAERVETVRVDLADLGSVRAAADELRARHPRIDLLVNNAGVLMAPAARTDDGIELQFATNHLGHFALTGLVLDALLAAPAARVVTVGSIGHVIGRLDLDGLASPTATPSRLRAYAQSKLANLLFAFELQDRLAAAGARAISLAAHPGSSATDIDRFIPRTRRALSPAAGILQQSPQMGALPLLRAATDPDARGGECYGPAGPLQWRGYPRAVRTTPRSHDPDLRRRLWSRSEQLSGVTYVL